MLLEEFDFCKKAIINPDMIHDKIDGFPETVIGIFSHHLFDRIVKFLGGEKIAEYSDVDGIFNIYKVSYKGREFGLVKARLGGPSCVGAFEDIISMGGKRIILLGNCGVLDKSIDDCGIIIPTKAIRDEGTSYHYAPASDYIDVNKKYISEFKAVCDELGYPYVEGITRLSVMSLDTLMLKASPGLQMLSTGRLLTGLQKEKRWALSALKWNVLQCRLYATLEELNISSSFMQVTTLIIQTGIQGAFLEQIG